jgi:hypothetical protein
LVDDTGFGLGSTLGARAKANYHNPPRTASTAGRNDLPGMGRDGEGDNG